MSALPPLRLGTRGSPLALWQARTVAARVEETSGRRCDIITIKTSGDRLQEAPLSEVGGKRLFVKEIEDALLRGDVDLAVHSSKDMPAALVEGLTVAGVLPREDPRDAVVLAADRSTAITTVAHLVAGLGRSPMMGTGSVRRISQLKRVLPGARFAAIRGNLDTRLRKLDDGSYDALVLAAAGLRRLGYVSRISFALPVDVCVPSPGQGIVAIEIRENDEVAREAVSRITAPDAAAALTAERAVVTALGGGCQTPIGALAVPVQDNEMELVAVVASLDGSRTVHARARGPREDAAGLGSGVGEELLAKGAGEILEQARRAQDADSGMGA